MIPANARHSIHRERKTKDLSRLTHEQEAFRRAGIFKTGVSHTKEELVSPSHLRPESFTSTFPELELNVTIVISV